MNAIPERLRAEENRGIEQITETAACYRVREIVEKHEHRFLVSDSEAGSSYRDEYGARHVISVGGTLSLALHELLEFGALPPADASEDTFWFGLFTLNQLIVFCCPLIVVLSDSRREQAMTQAQHLELGWITGGLVAKGALSLHLQRWYTVAFGPNEQENALARLKAATEIERRYAAFRVRMMIHELSDA